MKKYLFLMGLLMPTLSLFAQEISIGKSLFSVHAGPSWYLGKMIGITNNSDAIAVICGTGFPGVLTTIIWGINISSIHLNCLPVSFIRVDSIKIVMMKAPIKF